MTHPFRVEGKKGCVPCESLEQAQEMMARTGGEISQFHDGRWHPWPLKVAADVAADVPVQRIEPGAESPDRTFDGQRRCKKILADGQRCARAAAMNVDYCGTHAHKETEPNAYASRHPGMKNPRWLGVAEKCAALVADQTLFIVAMPGELPSLMASRLRAALSGWNATRDFRFSVQVLDNGVLVQKRWATRANGTTQQASAVSTHLTAGQCADVPADPGSGAGSEPIAAQSSTISQPEGAGKPDAVKPRLNQQEKADPPTQSSSGAAGTRVVVASIESPGVAVALESESDLVKSAPPRIDEFLELALYFHSSGNARQKPSQPERFDEMAHRLNVLADDILLRRRARESATVIVKTWLAKWPVPVAMEGAVDLAETIADSLMKASVGEPNA